jgi:hypothetical protein
MSSIFLGKYLRAGVGVNDPARVLIFETPETGCESEPIGLTERQLEILNILTEIDGVGDILLTFARAGARLGKRLGNKSSYTETAGELAPPEEQDILKAIFRERGIDPDQLEKCVVTVKSHGRRRIEFDSSDYCKFSEKAWVEIPEEFNRRIALLPE